MKKETQEISLWLKMSFLKKKQRESNWTLMQIKTLGESLSWARFLEKVVQFGWLGISTNSLPSLFLELGMDCMNDQDGSWMKIRLKSHWVSSIILIMELFLQIFCENILMVFTIMLCCHSWLNESIVFYCHGFLDIFLSAICNWTYAFRKDKD